MSGEYENINGVPQFEQGGEQLGFGRVIANESRRVVGLPIVSTDFKGVIQGSPVQITRPMLNMVGNRYGSNIPSNPVQPSQEDLEMYYRRQIPYPTDMIKLAPSFNYGQRSKATKPPVTLYD